MILLLPTPLLGATSVLQKKLGGCHYSLQPWNLQQHECGGLHLVFFSSLLDSPRYLFIPSTPGALGPGQIQLVSSRMGLSASGNCFGCSMMKWETPASFSFCSSANTCCTLNLCFFPPFWWCSLSKRPDYSSKAPCWGHASIVWPWSVQICAGLRWEGPFVPIKSSRLLQENGSLLKWFTCLSTSLW